MSEQKARQVKTTKSSIGILQYIKDNDGATMNELAADLGMAKSTVHNHVSTLEAEQFLLKQGRTYHIGYRMLEFGEYSRNRDPLHRPAKIQVYRLAEATNEEANFTISQGGYMYTIEYVMGDPSPQNPEAGSQFLKIGNKFHMHNSSPGKAVLSQYDEERVRQIVDRHGLPQTTESTITSVDRLFDELEAISERGYATDDEELKRGYRSIAAPVVAQDDSIIGALSIGGPAYRFDVSTPQISESVSTLMNAVERVKSQISELEDTSSS